MKFARLEKWPKNYTETLGQGRYSLASDISMIYVSLVETNFEDSEHSPTNGLVFLDRSLDFTNKMAKNQSRYAPLFSGTVRVSFEGRQDSFLYFNRTE